MTLDEILARIDGDRDEHVLAGPAAASDLDALESRLGVSLPASYRAFLARFGGGLFYQRHEVFGPRRVVVHDIDLVPDLVTFRRDFQPGGAAAAPHWLPFHHADAVTHAFDLREAPAPTRVHAVETGRVYADLAQFLAAVLVPAAAG